MNVEEFSSRQNSWVVAFQKNYWDNNDYIGMGISAWLKTN